MQGSTKTRESNSPAVFLNRLDRSIVTAQRDLEKQERFVNGLKLARESVANAILVDATKPAHHNGNGAATNGSRVQRIKTILDSAPGPVTVDDIMAEMAKHGIHDEKRLVHSSLSYLKRTGSVKNPDRGQWVSVTENGAVAA